MISIEGVTFDAKTAKAGWSNQTSTPAAGAMTGLATQIVPQVWLSCPHFAKRSTMPVHHCFARSMHRFLHRFLQNRHFS